MASVYKVKITYQQGGFAATETYWSQPFEMTNTGAAAFVTRLNAMLELRNGLMFTTHQWISVDIANVDDPRRSILLRPGGSKIPPGSANVVVVPQQGQITVTPVSQRPEQMRVAALVEVTFDSSRRRSRRYMSSVPDRVTFYDPNTIDRDGSNYWFSAFAGWSDEMTAGYWQLHAKRSDGAFALRPVQGLVLAAPAPSNVGLVLASGDAPGGWTKGTQVDVGGFKAFPGKCPCPTINGRWTIDSRNDTLIPGSSIFYLQNSSGIDPLSWKHMGHVQQRGFSYYIWEDVNLIGTAIHKRGNGSRRAGKRKALCCAR